MEARERIVLAFVERLFLNESGLDIDGWTEEHKEEVAGALEKVGQPGAAMALRRRKDPGLTRRIECGCPGDKTTVHLCTECATLGLHRQEIERQVDGLGHKIKRLVGKSHQSVKR